MDKNGNTPLHHASANDNVKIVRHLLNEGANVNVQNNDGNTPLHFAAEKGRLGVIRLLLERRADVNVQDKDGNTPLVSAAVGGHVDVVRVLLKPWIFANYSRLLLVRSSGHDCRTSGKRKRI
jgi:ankyrin repeat protein